ncbi:hypothetical protein [Streptomyces sp. NPDC056785]|uniref:hypothetical protein n=1 Tax=Streptomyces sp. NPDC056785 TaxID=3345944 RepID=UPI00369C8E82
MTICVLFSSRRVFRASGQLATYAFLLYRAGCTPRRIALFIEAIGEVYVRLLSHQGIASSGALRMDGPGQLEAAYAGLARNQD